MATTTRKKPAKSRRKKSVKLLRLAAIEVKQGKSRRLYSFAVDGKSLHDFCTISRVSRQGDEGLEGYQRPEVMAHINQIRDYLESENPLLPNAIVVAFDDTVKFKPNPGKAGKAGTDSPFSRSGVLEIPIDDTVAEEDKPGWIVDGQQRSAALRDARISGFPVCVIGFLAEGLEEQRQQFILVNATKPLPKGLIYELLPSTGGKLPVALQRRRHPALISERMNFDDDSPLHGMIRTPTNGTGVVADNTILKMLENSLVRWRSLSLHRHRRPTRFTKRILVRSRRSFPGSLGTAATKIETNARCRFHFDGVPDGHHRGSESKKEEAD